MKKVYLILSIAVSGVFVAMSICRPDILAKNEFLVGFVNHEVLNIMAVIMTISIASIATIHIWFNELEDKHQQRVFGGARRQINQAAFLFIGLFLAQLVLLIIRSLEIFEGSDIARSLFNGASVILLLCTVLTLADIMSVVRALTPAD